MIQEYLTVQKIICSLALAKSIMYIINNSEPNIEPWGTPVELSCISDFSFSISTYLFLLVK